MNRFWSLLFLMVPVLGIGTFVMAMYGMKPLESARMPESLSEIGDTIDVLFNGLHLLAAILLMATVATIGVAFWKFDHGRNDNAKGWYVTNNRKLELVWTIIPACLLLCLAYFQMSSWSQIKLNRPMMMVDGESVPAPPMVLVKAKRFGWEFYYAGDDGLVNTLDDVFVENLLVLPANEDVVLQLESLDVIHSFCVPELRLKQDVVPGMIQMTWFKARKPAEVEVMCTELCGWGHYLMKADLKLVERPEFETWLADQTSEYRPDIETTELRNDQRFDGEAPHSLDVRPDRAIAIAWLEAH